MNYRRNYSGCYDPTAGMALEHIVRDERRKRKRARKQEQTGQNEPPVTQQSKHQRYVNTPGHRRR